MSAASDDFQPPEDEPTRALLLAQALDMCIGAERRLPGSADHIIAHQPTWAREELRRLVSLAGSLDAVATSAVMDDEFRVAARSRLLQRIRGGLRNGTDAAAAEYRWGISTFPSTNGHHAHGAVRGRKRRWVWRAGAGGLLAAALGIAATLTASATALPGEPLYPIKQAREELGVRFAPDDQARALALLNQGDARLYETTRLLQAGRTSDVAQTTRRFDEAIDRATTTFVVTIVDAPAEAPATTSIETRLSAQQAQLETLISSAPEQARADLRQALMATTRGLALVADTQADQSVERSTPGAANDVAAAVPTTFAETVPTIEPPKVVQAPPRASSGAVPDKHDTEVAVVDQPPTEDAAAASATTDASPAPAAPQVAADRGARVGPVHPASNLGEPARSSRSDDGEGEQHFEPVTTTTADPGAIAQVPQVSQQSPPHHLDITLSSDSESGAASVQTDARHDDQPQASVAPASRADDHPQVAEQQTQPAIAQSQGPTQQSARGSGSATSSRGESDNSAHTGAVNATTNSSHGSSNTDDNGGRSSGGGGSDHNARPTTDQNSKVSGEGSRGGSSSGGGTNGSSGNDGGRGGGGDAGHGGNGGHGD